MARNNQDNEIKEASSFAVTLAKKAGKLLMMRYFDVQRLEYKLRTNFKISVDDESDCLIRNAISHRFPTHTVYSEEHSTIPQKCEWIWIVDPLDGTIPYTFGISDHFAVSIALVRDGTLVLGVIYAPKRKELYFAEQGRGAFCNGSRISVASLSQINKSMVGIDYGKYDRAAVLRYQSKLLSQSGITYPVTYGCASVSLALVATGKLHGYLALRLEPWDMSAAVILIREAGGRVTTVGGEEWKVGDKSIFTASPQLHRQLLKYLGKT